MKTPVISNPALYFNIIFQLTAIFAWQYFAVIWPLYIVMALMGIFAFVQTLGIPIILANTTNIDHSKNIQKMSHTLLAFTYIISSCQLAFIGYTVFAGYVGANAIILLLTAQFKKETE